MEITDKKTQIELLNFLLNMIREKRTYEQKEEILELVQKLLKENTDIVLSQEDQTMLNEVLKNPKITEDDYEDILAHNPFYIENILNPSKKLQIIAAKHCSNPIELLDVIKHPCDELYAYLLYFYNYKDPRFNDQFKNGIPNNIINIIIELHPEIAFDSMRLYKQECTPSQKERAIEINPTMIDSPHFLTQEVRSQLTPELIIKFVEEYPANLGIIGSELKIYTRSLLDHARKYINIKHIKDKEYAINTINIYAAMVEQNEKNNWIFEEAFEKRKNEARTK